MNRETRLLFQHFKICPNCRKNELFGSEKLCIECKAYFASKNKEWRDKHIDEYRKMKSARSKMLTAERKKLGLCTRCGKRKNTEGFSTCQICRKKLAEVKRRSYGNKSNKQH